MAVQLAAVRALIAQDEKQKEAARIIAEAEAIKASQSTVIITQKIKGYGRY